MEEEPKILHNFGDKKENFGFHSQQLFKKSSIILLLIFLAVGIATGYIVAKMKSGTTNSTTSSAVGNIEGIKKGDIVGIKDEDTFKDSAEGIVREGGINGEGAYHLERPGGESQNVYMTSSVFDMSQFVGKKVKVWGQTQAAEKAGWLMDVGRLQLLE